MEEFLQLFAESIHGLDRASITPETRFRTLPQWDSLAVLTTLALADSEYGVTLTAAQLRQLDTLADLHRALLRAGPPDA